MRKVILFGEDYAHEVVLRTLLARLADEVNLPVEVNVRSATEGTGACFANSRTSLRSCGAGSSRSLTCSWLLATPIASVMPAGSRNWAPRSKGIRGYSSRPCRTRTSNVGC